MLPCWLLPAACTAFALLSCWAWWRFATLSVCRKASSCQRCSHYGFMRCPVIGRAIAQYFMLSAICGFALHCLHNCFISFPLVAVEPYPRYRQGHEPHVHPEVLAPREGVE